VHVIGPIQRYFNFDFQVIFNIFICAREFFVLFWYLKELMDGIKFILSGINIIVYT